MIVNSDELTNNDGNENEEDNNDDDGCGWTTLRLWRQLKTVNLFTQF